MASMTMNASFLGVPAATKQHLPSTARRGVAIVRASMDSSNKTTVAAAAAAAAAKEEGSSNNTRRDLMFAAAAAAACAVARVAMADEPKRGTAEAKKKYAPICVTMPTARVCHN